MGLLGAVRYMYIPCVHVYYVHVDVHSYYIYIVKTIHTVSIHVHVHYVCGAKQ